MRGVQLGGSTPCFRNVFTMSACLGGSMASNSSPVGSALGPGISRSRVCGGLAVIVLPLQPTLASVLTSAAAVLFLGVDIWGMGTTEKFSAIAVSSMMGPTYGWKQAPNFD